MERDFNKIVRLAASSDCIIAGFNVFGLEDAKAVAEVAEELNAPLMLMLNRQAVDSMDVAYWADALLGITSRATAPVCLHLDHMTDIDILKRAVKAGFHSVMFDGSQLPIDENIKRTREAADFAHERGVYLEAEIGAVGYPDKDPEIYKNILTDPNEAQRFATESGVDWLAVSVGNFHKMTVQTTQLDFDRIARIQEVVAQPLVLHGGTGLPDDQMRQLMKCHVGKINIGTSLRMAFGYALRREFEADPDAFDRIPLFERPLLELKEAAREKARLLKLDNFFERYGK